MAPKRRSVKSPAQQPADISDDSALNAPEVAGALVDLPAELAVADASGPLLESQLTASEPLLESQLTVADAPMLECKKEETDEEGDKVAMSRRNAKRGCGMNPLEVSRMLAVLKKRRKKDRACLRIRKFACLVFKFILIHVVHVFMLHVYGDLLARRPVSSRGGRSSG